MELYVMQVKINMETSIKVSVCVPIYGVEQYIEKCVRSLMEQTMKDNIEFIFVNDCTKDKSIEILKNVISDYPERINQVKIINHETNKGLAAARNTSINVAIGQYIIHIDSDDYLELNAIKELYTTAIKYDADLVFSDFNIILKNGHIVYRDYYNNDKLIYLSQVLTRKRLVNIIGKLIKKEIITANNLWEIEGINQGEDYLMTPRIIYYANTIKKVDLPLYNYNRSNNLSYTSTFNEKGVDDLIKVQDQLITFFANVSDALVYKQVINQSKIYNKITLFYNAPLNSYKKIAALYPEIAKDLNGISLKHKALLYIINLGFYKLSYNIIKIIKRWR